MASIDVEAKRSATVSHCQRPAALSSGSACPWILPAAFQTVCAWRMMISLKNDRRGAPGL
jgi:hypothetical protein